MLLNLLTTPASSPSTGTITLTVARDGGSRVRFSVSDTGIGMTQSSWPAVPGVHPGRCLDRQRYGGTGLGLAITRHSAR